MNSALIFGNTSALKAAQCGQVIEAYSVMVTLASAGPSAMSGRDTGFATSVALCAIASLNGPNGERPTTAARPVLDRAAVKTRRVMIKGLLPDWRIGGRNVPNKQPFASLKFRERQWSLAKGCRGEKLNFA